VRFHDLHGDGRFSLIEFARSRREREERREKRRKALARFGLRRWLSIALAVVRWHLASPDWSPRGRRGAVPTAAEPVVMPALEHLMEARNAAQRDGEAELAAVIRAVVLFYLTGNLDDFYERSAAALKLYDDMMAEPVGRVH
jgi:hypothetical protein